MKKGTVIIAGCALLAAWLFASCSSGSKNSAPGLTPTQQAAASASAAQGAVSLSSAVGSAAMSSEGYLPAQVQSAPGKKAASTGPIANIDPRLKDAVDKMRAHLNRPAVAQGLPKPGMQKTLGAAANMACAVSGSYSVTNNTVTTGPSGTVHSFGVTWSNCQDSAIVPYSILTGGITGTYTNGGADQSAQMQINNLTAKEYDAGGQTGYVTMNGYFTSQATGTASGSNTANGSFIAVSYVEGLTLSFSFSNVSDIWTSTGATLPSTDESTGNGSFSLTITNNANGQSIGLTVALTNMVSTFRENSDFSTDEWYNGTVTITWTPDLSQWGCLHGSYVFTTAAPLHTPSTGWCPTGGTMQVNNAQFEFGVPGFENVTVTLLPNGPSEVFADCFALDSGMCN